MNAKRCSAVLGFCLGVLAAAPAFAQNTNQFTFNIGGGFTEPVKNSENRLDRGYNINVGAGLNLTPAVGVIGEFGYNNLGVPSGILAALAATEGAARLYSLTVNPIVRFNPNGRSDFYLIGGGGYYRRTVEFTRPTAVIIPGLDPFYGVTIPVALPPTAVAGSFSQDRLGWNFGGGVTFQLTGDSNLKFYAEARYHYIDTEPISTNMLPVTFGLRW